MRATARPGDLVLLPAGLGRTVFGLDAARIAAIPEVGVGIVAGPFRSGAYVTAPSVSGSFVGPARA